MLICAMGNSGAVPKLQFDFDALDGGALREQSDNSPNSIGLWSVGSSVAQLVDGNLEAPAASNYAFSNSESAGHVVSIRADSAYRGQFHQTVFIDGLVWVSALVKAQDGTAAVVVFDGANTSNSNGWSVIGKPGFGIRPIPGSSSTEFFWSDDLTDLSNNQSVSLAADYEDEVVLVLARIDFSSSANNVDLWINPVLENAAALGATGDLEATTQKSGFDWIGIGVADSGFTGYHAAFDNILVSDAPDEEVAFANVTGLPLPASEGSVDVNGNGISDFAELRYPRLSSQAIDTDTDGDGMSDLAEVMAGTDPDDPTSLFAPTGFASQSGPGAGFDFSFTSVPGVRYGVQVGRSLHDWATLDFEVTATSSQTTVSVVVEDDRSFVRAIVLPPLDSDADGLEDSLESFLGFSSSNAASVRSAATGGDLQQFINLMSGGNSGGGLAGTGGNGVPSEEQASRFLAQASFGPSPRKIDEFRDLGPNAYEKWIDLQIAESPNYLRTYVDMLWARGRADSEADDYSVFPHFVSGQSDFANFRENLNTVWMRQALFADDELRQRVAWSLSQIVVIGPRCNSYALAAGDWYDTILRHSFGNYRDLLYDISVHPWMGWWLSHIGNRKADPSINQFPDENFSREIMQLFSIGLWELNMDGTRVLDGQGDPIPTYDNEDIVQLARVFTGLDRQIGTSGRAIYSTAPMAMYEDRHDDGNSTLAAAYGGAEKTFLSASLPAFADDPGRTGLDDVSDAVDVLINHPSCPPFISKNLIQHLVTSNPSPAYVERVASVFADDGSGTRGNLAATIKAILMDPEARNFPAALDPNFGRLKGPMLRTVSLARAMEAGAATPALHDLTGIQFWSPRKTEMFGDFLEYPFESPSVFNFYEPGYSRPGEVRDLGLVSPEFQIMNALTATTVPNRLWFFIENGFHDRNNTGTPEFELQLEPVMEFTDDTDALVDHMNLIFAHGTMSAETRGEIASKINYYSANAGNARARTQLAIYLSLISPDGAVLK